METEEMKWNKTEEMKWNKTEEFEKEKREHSRDIVKSFRCKELNEQIAQERNTFCNLPFFLRGKKKQKSK